ncbi:hypothetical protein, partial [Enterococcus gallinarum]
IVIPPAIFFYYSTLFDSRFKTLQQNRIVLIVGMELKTLKKEQLFKVKERHNQLLCSKTGTMNIEYRTEYLELTNQTDFLLIRKQQEQEKN